MFISNRGPTHAKRGADKTGLPTKTASILLSGILSATLAAFPSGLSAFAETGIDANMANTNNVAQDAVQAGDFLVTGGVQGEDWSHDGSILHIKSSAPITVANADSNKSTTQTIQIDPGVKADLTLAGVNILNNSRSPLNLITNLYDIDSSGNANTSPATDGDAIVNKTTLHLTLADGTVNYFKNNADANGRPGIRCGWGSVLVIDDSVANIKAGGSKLDLGSIVMPESGVVPYDTQLIGGETIHKGEPLSVMDTGGTRGRLVAQGGRDNASIGSESRENSGTMVFNGGDVEALGYVATDHSAGIGSGCGGSGTRMVFNGGSVKAKAAACGAAIGCGAGLPVDYCGSFASSTDAIPIPRGIENSNSYSYIGTSYVNVAGDININGGDVYAEGGGHGNAIGQAGKCGVSTNREHVIKVTGGTVTTSTPAIPTSIPMYGIGARLGYTIVTGGSIHLRLENSFSHGFEGIGDTAYNTQNIETWADVQRYEGNALPETDKVHAVGIDFSGENVTDNRISDWRIYVQNMPYSYGAPDHFQDGKLYLWLPKSVVSKEIAVEFSYVDNEGKPRKVDRLFGTPAVTGGTLKRYAKIVVPDAYTQSLSKEYDGSPISQYDFSEPLSTSEADVVLRESSKLTYKYQYFNKVDGDPLGEEIPVTDPSAMPRNAGIIKLTMDSTEYSTHPNYSTSYWGHRGSAWLEIKPLELGAASIMVSSGTEAIGGNGVLPAGAAGLTFGLDIDESKLVEGESADDILNDFVIRCTDKDGNQIDSSNPKPGIYTATLAPGANGIVRDDGTVVSGGYAVKADPVTFVVADEGAEVVEGVDVKLSVSSGSGTGSGPFVLNAEDVYNLVASDPKSGLPAKYDPDKTDIVITLDGTPVDAVDSSKPGIYGVTILSKGDGSDSSEKGKVVFSELKVTRPSSGGAGSGSGVSGEDNSGTDNPGSGAAFAPIDTTTDIRLDPSATGTVGGDPYFEYDADRPVNILDVIQVRPEGDDGWSQWVGGSDDPDNPGNPSNPSDPSNPNNPANPGASGDPDNPDNPTSPNNPSKPNDPGDPSNPDSPITPTTPQLPDDVKVTVTDEAGRPVDPTNITEPGTYEVTVSVKDPDTGGFVVVVETLTFHVVDTSITDTDQIYSDVAKDHWGHGYIFDIGPAVINGCFNPSGVALGYMGGYAGTTNFGPANSIIRGDAAIVIWRMAGCPDVEGDEGQDGPKLLSLANTCYTGFADCDASPGMYYNKAIRWCAQNGIVEGYAGTGEYRPQNCITREEFASIIARYAAFKGKDVTSAGADLTQYPDIQDVSAWALPNMRYVVANGIMTGKGTDEGTALGSHGILDPQAHVTRAEVAKMAYMEQPEKF